MTGAKAEDAFDRALKFLRYRARSANEVRTKLKRLGYSPQTVDLTLRKLTSLSLLNDESFARNWALTRVEQRGYGPLRVARELHQKGIEKSLINQILAEAFARDTAKITDTARALLERRFSGKDLRDLRNLRRAAAFLQRRGYPSSVIGELLQDFHEES
jgi:regulatory protein